MFYPVFSVLLLAYTFYYQNLAFFRGYNFNRDAAQIGRLSLDMGFEIGRQGLSEVESVQELYRYREAPELIRLLVHHFKTLDGLPDSYTHPKNLVFPVAKFSTLCTTVLVDTLISNARALYQISYLIDSVLLDREISLLHSAVRTNSKEAAETLLRLGFDANSDNSLLHLAVQNKNADMVELLLKFGADIHVLNSHDKTPLSLAISHGDLAIVKLLLANGADVNAHDKNGNTPLIYAVGYEKDEVIRLLLELGADVNKCSAKSLRTPLHYAAARGTKRIIELLLEGGADIEAKNKLGDTPLMDAIKCRNEPTVQLLLELGADAKKLDRDSLNVVDAARKSGLSEKTIKLLEEKLLQPSRQVTEKKKSHTSKVSEKKSETNERQI